MLASNAHGDAFSLFPTWAERSKNLLSSEAAAAAIASASASAAAAAAGSVAGRVRLAAVVAQRPITLATVLPGERIDGVDLVGGDTVLLVAQTNARENGIWTCVAAGNAAPATRTEDPFQGMLVRIAKGTVAAGWLYVCTQYAAASGAVFAPVYGPGPTKLQVDALRVDAATVGGQTPASLIAAATTPVPLTSAGGDASLVADGANLRLRGLRAGVGVALDGDNPNAVRIAAGTRGLVCALRPADVVATGGLFVLSTTAPPPLGLPAGWPAEWATLSVPLLMYRLSPAASHTGDAVFVLHGVPASGEDLGFRLEASVLAPPAAAGAVWSAQLFRAGPMSSGTSGDRCDGTLRVPQTAGACVLTFEPSASGVTAVCIDGQSRPILRSQGPAELLGLRLTGSGPLGASVAFLGFRLALMPIQGAP